MAVDIVTNSRAGMMPAWVDRLDPVTVKQLAVYVHSLGGGE
jgi:cytochrome c oxidase cbb3-type subunit 3